MADDSPFHRGELLVQERVGSRERVDRAGRRMIRDYMPDEHRTFFEELPFLVVGSIDDAGRPWASILSGEPGFVTSPHPRSLMVAALPNRDDPLARNLRAEAPLGVLGIQLETRRRNRANGKVQWCSERGFELFVEQSFGNCKQYIHTREPRAIAAHSTAEHGSHRLSPRALELIRGCDTAFIASVSEHPRQGSREGVDVSHRGGSPGFIRVEPNGATTRLTLPDYRGNFLFNTLGNIEVNPRAGLVCCDFETGDLLTLTGTAKVIWQGAEIATFDGAERLLELEVEEYVLLGGGLGQTWAKTAA
ncbi:MAG TPA: pyridoxamine 5'-phosphate oxidase family protein [Polyangiaceae bacterium]|nr:pyridoxamine 5'-phosphate oxidase family protein [Polyangiaceae bacterium]